MNRLNGYCKRNIVAQEWLSAYRDINLFIENLVDTRNVSESAFQEFEELTIRMYKLFDNIKTNPGLQDWFIEFVENQTTQYAGLLSYYLKHYNENLNDTFISFFEDIQKNIKKYEKELNMQN